MKWDLLSWAGTEKSAARKTQQSKGLRFTGLLRWVQKAGLLHVDEQEPNPNDLTLAVKTLPFRLESGKDFSTTPGAEQWLSDCLATQ